MTPSLSTLPQVPRVALLGLDEARELARTLVRRGPDGAPVFWASVEVEPGRRAARQPDGRAGWASVPEARILFHGSLLGRHSLALEASTRARVLAHWDGYRFQGARAAQDAYKAQVEATPGLPQAIRAQDPGAAPEIRYHGWREEMALRCSDRPLAEAFERYVLALVANAGS